MGLKEVIKRILAIFLPEQSKRDDNREYSLSLCNGNKVVEINHVINNFYNLNIDITKLKQEEKEKLIEIYPEISQNNGLILEKKEFAKFKEYKDECKETPILKFFKGKIKEEDYQALRISIYIQKKSSEGEDITSSLKDLYGKYGKKGKNINNLYGRGYFDNFLKLYYLYLMKESREDEFQKFFDKFVIEQPMTYFVSQLTSQERVNEELLYKILRCKKYGIKRLNIHGIGKDNKEKTKEFAELIKDRNDVKIISMIEVGATISLVLEISNLLDE